MINIATDIILKVSKLDSIFGYSAKMALDKKINYDYLIHEYYNEILENKVIIESHFGKELVEEICYYINEKH